MIYSFDKKKEDKKTKELRNIIYEQLFKVIPEGQEKIKLNSGKYTKYYFDIRERSTSWLENILIGYAYDDIIDDIKERIGEKQHPLLRVGGLETGSLPIITAVIREHQLNGFFVRKEPKKYGLRQQIEGNMQNCEYVILVDDIVTSGKSILKCIDVINKYNHKIKVLGVYPLIDRNQEIENYDLFHQLKSKCIEYKPIFESTEFINKYNYEHIVHGTIGE